MTELRIPYSTTDWAAGESSDTDEIDRAKRDPKAFAVLYRQHYDAIIGHVYRRTGDAHAAEDIVADVFLAAMRSISRFRYRGIPFRAWLFRIATNRVNRWARGRRRAALQAFHPHGEAEVAEAETERRRPADSGWARRALLTLGPKYQSVLALHYLEEMGIKEIAVVIGCRVGTVKSRLSRGRAMLRERLTQGR